MYWKKNLLNIDIFDNRLAVFVLIGNKRKIRFF